MGLDRATELLIRNGLNDMVVAAGDAGYVIPSARYCSDVADYWASRDQTKDTQLEIEMALIDSVWIYPLNFLDDRTAGGADSPRVGLIYEIYIFRGYGLEREDESEFPDIFSSKVLKQHNDFVASWLDIKAAFQRKANMAGMDTAIFAEMQSTPVVQVEPIQNLAVCEFVPGAVGYSVRLQETVNVRLREC